MPLRVCVASGARHVLHACSMLTRCSRFVHAPVSLSPSPAHPELLAAASADNCAKHAHGLALVGGAGRAEPQVSACLYRCVS